MTDHEATWRAHQHARWMGTDAQRWMRPDAERWIRQDVARFLKPVSDLADVFPALDRKFNPNQPRIPAGRTGGGRWTDGSDGGTRLASGQNDPRIVSDADPIVVSPGQQFAQVGRRGIRSFRINGQRVEATPSEEAELQAVEARAEGAIARVHELDPNWKPQQGSYQSVRGLIEEHRYQARQAEDHLADLARMGIGPGPFACESIPARGPERNFTAAERREGNRIGYKYGCHTCGSRDPGTPLGNFVLDHQDPSALNSTGLAQRLYPQCLSCSLKQGGYVNALKGGR